jgi:hypothetical protein
MKNLWEVINTYFFIHPLNNDVDPPYDVFSQINLTGLYL